MRYTRREAGQVALGTIAAAAFAGIAPCGAWAWQASRSRINGVRLGAITYSFRTMPNVDDIIKAMADIGLGEVELMSNHAEAAAGAPSGRAAGAGRGGGNTPEALAAREELRKWRLAISRDTFRPVRQKFEAAGIAVTPALLQHEPEHHG